MNNTFKFRNLETNCAYACTCTKNLKRHELHISICACDNILAGHCLNKESDTDHQCCTSFACIHVRLAIPFDIQNAPWH